MSLSKCRFFCKFARTYSTNTAAQKIYINVDKHVVRSTVKDINLPKLSIHDYVFESIQRWPNKTAIECLESGRKYTFNDIYEKSIRISYFLRNSLKLKEGNTIVIVSHNIAEYPLIVLGALHANLKVATVNPILGPEEVSKQINLVEAKAIFTVSSLCKMMPTALCRRDKTSIVIDHENSGAIPEHSVNFLDTINHDNTRNKAYPDLNQTALMLFSSGTTGLPKAVELSHWNIVSNLAQMTCHEFCLGEIATDDFQEVATGILPFFHVYGLVTVLLHRICMGSKVVVVPKFGSESFLKLLIEHKPTLAHLVPPIVLMMIHRPDIKPEYIQSLKEIVVGAAPIGIPDMDKFEEKTGGKIPLIQAYGMTETSPLVISQSRKTENGYVRGAAGLLIPNTKAKIVELSDLSEKGLGPNKSGELWLKGPQVMKGYYKNQEATRATLTEHGWIKTGDIAHYDDTGNFYITDRLKELIKVKGFQVAPAELEALLRSHPSIEEAAVIGIPHQKHGEVPKAFVVKKQNSEQDLSPEEIQDFVAKKVANYKQLLGGVVITDSIPKNASGKILRKELQNM